MRRRVLALTGTPGVGKSTLVPALKNLGLTVLTVDELVGPARAVTGYDRRRRSRIVDVDRVDRHLSVRLRTMRGPVVIEGHLSHLLASCTHALVLRLRPRVLARRLSARGWPRAKVRENLEAEAIDLILQEAVGRFGARKTYEIDATRLRGPAIARRVAAAARGESLAQKNLQIGRVEWSGEILRWY